MINVNTSCHDVLVLANEDPDDTLPHPFWYACVLGVYHAQVLYGQISAWKKVSLGKMVWL